MTQVEASLLFFFFPRSKMKQNVTAITHLKCLLVTFDTCKFFLSCLQDTHMPSSRTFIRYCVTIQRAKLNSKIYLLLNNYLGVYSSKFALQPSWMYVVVVTFPRLALPPPPLKKKKKKLFLTNATSYQSNLFDSRNVHNIFSHP